MHNGIAACRAQGNGLYLPVLTTALAKAEAYAGEVDAASLTIETAITETELEAETRRTHGEFLLRRDPANTRAAEGAFGVRPLRSRKSRRPGSSSCARQPTWPGWRDQQKRK